MRRRGLFAGLAGLLAAPKVAAAVPVVVGVDGGGGAGLTWCVPIGADFDFVAGETVKLHWHDSVEAILPLSRDAAGRLRVWREADAAGPAVDAVQPLPQPDDAAGVIRQLICRLRKRLPPGSLTTVWGRGYRLDAEVARTLPQLDERLLVPADDAR